MLTGRRCAAVGALLFAGALAGEFRADLIRLKNGGTIRAESWEERGPNLVVRQTLGTIVVPRAEVAEIVREPAAARSSAAGPSNVVTRTANPPIPEPAGKGEITKEEAERRLAELKRRIQDLPAARAASERQIVALLDHLGRQAYGMRDFDQGLARFQEALGYDAHDAVAQHGVAASYLAQGRDIYARSTLQQALLDHPDDPDLLALLGNVEYAQENPEEALAAWRKAYAIRPDTVIKERIDKAEREHRVDRTYRRSDAAHFTLKYDGDRTGPDLGGEIVDYLEGRFSDLVTRFDYYPPQSIVVILYPAQQFYEVTQVESNVTGLFDGKIRVPIGGLKQLNHEARAVLTHELAHAFIAGKSGGTAPRWLHEGMAQLIEGKLTPRATAVSLAREFQEQTAAGSAWGDAFTYPSALSFVEYLDGRLGFPRLVDVLGAMTGGGSADAAFESTTRYSLKELRQAWGEDLVLKHLQ